MTPLVLSAASTGTKLISRKARGANNDREQRLQVLFVSIQGGQHELPVARRTVGVLPSGPLPLSGRLIYELALQKYRHFVEKS